MKKPCEKKPLRVKTKSAGVRNGAIRILRVRKGDDLKTLYAKVRASFTAADLQRYTEDEPMIPADDLAAELEAMLERRQSCSS